MCGGVSENWTPLSLSLLPPFPLSFEPLLLLSFPLFEYLPLSFLERERSSLLLLQLPAQTQKDVVKSVADVVLIVVVADDAAAHLNVHQLMGFDVDARFFN